MIIWRVTLLEIQGVQIITLRACLWKRANLAALTPTFRSIVWQSSMAGAGIAVILHWMFFVRLDMWMCLTLNVSESVEWRSSGYAETVDLNWTLNPTDLLSCSRCEGIRYLWLLVQAGRPTIFGCLSSAPLICGLVVVAVAFHKKYATLVLVCAQWRLVAAWYGDQVQPVLGLLLWPLFLT